MEVVTMAIAGVLAAAFLMAQHYFPWRKLLGKELPRVAAYVMGVLALLVPLTLLFLTWWWMGADAMCPYGWAAAALWVVTVFGGGAVMLCYLFDGWLNLRGQEKASRREGEKLRGVMDEDAELWHD